MPLVTTISVGRLLSRGELITTAKLNAIVRGIVINISGSVGSSDLAAGAVDAAATSADAFWYAVATSNAVNYVAVYPNPVASYIEGMWLSFRADQACKASPTFDAGAGPFPLVKYGGQRLAAGDLWKDGIATVRWNPTSTLVAGGCWEVMSLTGPRPITEDFQKAGPYNNGVRGLVPMPKAGATRLYLRDDGWQDLTPFVSSLVQALGAAPSNLAQFLYSSR